jgi:hypothetical protein
MVRKLLLACLAVLLCGATAAEAQRRSQKSGFAFQEQDHKAEIGVIGGYVWTTALDFATSLGPVSADIADSEFFGIEADINVRPGTQLVLLWQQQNSDFELKGIGVPSGVLSSTGVNVQYWQIGGLGGMQNGKVMPYGKFTLGGTRYQVDGFTGDEWQFSMIFGIGAKIYPNERIAIRLEGTLPFTVTNGGVGVGVGTGGAGVYMSGTGISQWTVALGANILLGSQ